MPEPPTTSPPAATTLKRTKTTDVDAGVSGRGAGVSGRRKKKETLGKENFSAKKRLGIDRSGKVAQERKRRADEIEHPSEEQKERFNRFIAEVLVIGVDGLLKEFTAEVKGYKPPDLTHNAFDQNAAKNRYRDVICLDETRVVLRSKENDKDKDKDKGDYIHANYVKGDPLTNTFICTQGPLASTCVDFWRMIVQERVGSIFMLCKVEELGKKKCEQYWPIKPGTQTTYGGYTVTCASVDSSDKRIIITQLDIEEAGKAITTLKHYQWMEWPDRSVPVSLLAIFRLLRLARSSRFPSVVHCSAGIGRTGAFVATELLLQRSVAAETVKMPTLIKQLRAMRAQSVQTDAQYVYLAMAIVNYCKEVGIMKPSFEDAFKKFKEAYDAFTQKRQTEEEVKMKAVAPDIACPSPPPPVESPSPAKPSPQPPSEPAASSPEVRTEEK